MKDFRQIVLFLVLALGLCALPTAAKTPPDPPSQTSMQKNTIQDAEEAILLVAFGTSQDKALIAYSTIETIFEGHGPLEWAYTSDIIRAKRAKQGIKLNSIDEALDSLAKKGIKTIRVQSLHVMGGEEFSQLERSVQRNLLKNPGRFESVSLGRPLLESEKDRDEVIAALLAGFPKERQPADAVVLMGHGQKKGRCDMVFDDFRRAIQDHDPLVFMGKVEGEGDFDVILADLKKKGIKRVWLQPFMIVAGDHAINDLAGDDDSWGTRLQAQGMQVMPHLVGLGELPGIGKVFHRHAVESSDNLAYIKEAK